MDLKNKSLGELKGHWESVKREATSMLAHIDALLGLSRSSSTAQPEQTSASLKQGAVEKPVIERQSRPERPARRATSLELIEAYLPRLERPVTQAELMRLLRDDGTSLSRQTMSVSTRKLAKARKLERRRAPAGSMAPFVYGRPDMFEPETVAEVYGSVDTGGGGEKQAEDHGPLSPVAVARFHNLGGSN